MELKITIDDSAVKALLEKLREKTGNMLPAMQEIGALLRTSMIKNFEVGGRYSEPGDWRGGPNKWVPLKQSTLVGRNSRFKKFRETTGGSWEMRPEKKRKGNILTVSARLRNSLTYRATSNSVMNGTNVVYAGIQNFGGQTKPHIIEARHKKALSWPGAAWPVRRVHHPGSKIPARPFLVAQEEDLAQMQRVLLRHILGSNA